MQERVKDDEQWAEIVRRGRASMAVDTHDDAASPFPRTRNGRHPLVNKLAHALLDYDVAYEDVLVEWPRKADGTPDKQTEERLKIATRNKMRERGQDLPILVLWDLRMAVGYRAEEE